MHTPIRHRSRPVRRRHDACAPAAGRVGGLGALLSGAGNHAVARAIIAGRVKGDAVELDLPDLPTPSLEEVRGGVPAPAPEAAGGPGSGVAGGEEDPGPLSGTPEPIEDDPIDKTGCEAPDAAGSAAGPPPSDAPGAVSAGPRLPIRARLEIVTRERRGPVPPSAHGGHAHGDDVKGLLGMGSNVVRSGAVSPFGSETASYRIDNIHWTRLWGYVLLTARVFLDITWNTDDGGNIDVSGPTDPAVTPATWAAIANDLDPDATGRPTRSTYWAKDLTERHELFHAKDDIDRATLYLPTAAADLNSRSIPVPVDDAAVRAVLVDIKDKVKADGWAWYGTGGEDRAYADGSAEYAARAAAVRARAASEGWT